ncbi:MAG: putative zinc-binding metallopeptidase [Candidatus Gracilibacteria bacterium]|nr:putative zinc-binding metallopeptidase [Candidatus Gracilibacteria bacterium]
MRIKDLKALVILTSIFTVIIFSSNSFFYKDENNQKEESFIDRQLGDNLYDSGGSAIQKNPDIIAKKALLSHIKKTNLEMKSASRLEAVFEPENYGAKIDKDYFYILQDLLESSLFDNVFRDKISGVETDLYAEKADVRGKMKNRAIHIFAPEAMKKSEFLSVYIHELGHYIDIYILEKDIIGDDSDNFYNISWKSVKTLKAGAKGEDFVSGYSMTNKYEDFAESFAYYVLHNKSFLIKAEKNDKLEQKYRFFSKYVFIDGQFKDTSFATNDKIKDYYWDITKIGVNYNKFLQYLKK